MYYWFQREARKMDPSPVHFWDWNRPVLPRLPGSVGKLAAGRVTCLTPGGLMFLWVVPMEILSRDLWVCSTNKQRLGPETSDGRQWTLGSMPFGMCWTTASSVSAVCLSVCPCTQQSFSGNQTLRECPAHTSMHRHNHWSPFLGFPFLPWTLTSHCLFTFKNQNLVLVWRTLTPPLSRVRNLKPQGRGSIVTISLSSR